jgi:succinyl-diaminopimelate desuccinylase
MSLLKTLERLITFKTISGNHAEAERALTWIEQELANVPLFVRRHTYDGFHSLIATTKRTKSPTLWLVAHVDVVPGGDHLFRPRIAHGRLYGRGAFDMKFAVASYMELMKELGSSVSDYDVGLMVTSDEEIGGFHGVKLLLEKGKYRGDLVVLPDGGGPWQFEEQAKGKMVVRVRTEGVAGHASRPWHGRNAIDELNAVLVELHDWFKQLRTKVHDHWRSTVVVTRIQGGEGDNMVPAHADALLDIRTVQGSHAVRIQKKFAALEKRYPNTRFEVACNEPAYGVSTKNGDAKRFARIAHEQHGISCSWTHSHGSSDARFFAAHGIPSLLILPNAGGAHSEEEWIDLKDLERYHMVLRQFVDEVAMR